MKSDQPKSQKRHREDGNLDLQCALCKTRQPKSLFRPWEHEQLTNGVDMKTAYNENNISAMPVYPTALTPYQIALLQQQRETVIAIQQAYYERQMLFNHFWAQQQYYQMMYYRQQLEKQQQQHQ